MNLQFCVLLGNLSPIATPIELSIKGTSKKQTLNSDLSQEIPARSKTHFNHSFIITPTQGPMIKSVLNKTVYSKNLKKPFKSNKKPTTMSSHYSNIAIYKKSPKNADYRCSSAVERNCFNKNPENLNKTNLSSSMSFQWTQPSELKRFNTYAGINFRQSICPYPITKYNKINRTGSMPRTETNRGINKSHPHKRKGWGIPRSFRMSNYKKESVK
jgi:hypothetical protein